MTHDIAHPYPLRQTDTKNGKHTISLCSSLCPLRDHVLSQATSATKLRSETWRINPAPTGLRTAVKLSACCTLWPCVIECCQFRGLQQILLSTPSSRHTQDNGVGSNGCDNDGVIVNTDYTHHCPFVYVDVLTLQVLYVEGREFDCQSRHQLQWLKFFIAFLKSPLVNCDIVYSKLTL
jgi:hypothetical protein